MPSDNDESNGLSGSSAPPAAHAPSSNNHNGVAGSGAHGKAGAGNAPVTKAVPASGAGLPFTGTDVLEIALIGALLLAAGLALRARLPRRRVLS